MRSRRQGVSGALQVPREVDGGVDQPQIRAMAMVRLLGRPPTPLPAVP